MDTDIMRRLERILEDARAVNAVLGDWDKIIADARKAMDLMRAAKVDLDAANELLAGVATLIAGVSVPAPVVPPTPPPEPTPTVPPPTTPPPVVVVPPPQPPPPVTPPRPRLGQLHIWCEGYDGTKCDSQLAKLQLPSDKVWIHVWDNASKWSNFGRRVLAIKNPNGGGGNTWDNPISDWMSAIDGFCRIAKAQSCSAVSIDLEGWLIATGPELIKYLYEHAHNVGLPVILVPRLGLNHLLTARDDNWAWTRPPPRANLTPRQVCDWLNHYADVDLQWDYGTNPQVFGEARTYLDGLGYTVPIVPMMDGAGRDGQQRIPDVAAATMVRVLWREFGSLGIFNPHNLGPAFSAALREIKL